MKRHPDRLDGRVRKTLEQWLRPGARILAAVSGGPDSVALLHLLRPLPYRVTVGHIDHALRRESRSDALFVERLARQWGFPYEGSRTPVKPAAARKRQSLEEAAREVRYAALARMARSSRCEAVLTAHTADDQAETVLLNFLRGAGPAGLSGMPPERRLDSKRPALRLLRPLLSTWKSDIHLYLRSNSIPFRIDRTNQDRTFRRNWIRHHLLPHLSREFPGFPARLHHMADIFRNEEAFWAEFLKDKKLKILRKDKRKRQIDSAGQFGYHRALSRRLLRMHVPGLSFQNTEKWLNTNEQS